MRHLKEGTVDVALMEEYFIEDKELKIIETEEYPFVVVAGTQIFSLVQDNFFVLVWIL